MLIQVQLHAEFQRMKSASRDESLVNGLAKRQLAVTSLFVERLSCWVS